MRVMATGSQASTAAGRLDANLGPIVPRFFGDASSALFGIYHAPLATPRPLGVVLCYPGPHEYRQAHWAYHKLATLLARAGLHVLRFDYFATGDSAGASADGTLARWIDDIETAVAELRDTTAVRRIALVGMRLGAALATRACARGLELSDLVLWDPVISGRSYLAQLDAVQQRTLRLARYPESVRRRADELGGFPISSTLRDAIAAVDLLHEPYGKPKRVVLVSGADRPEFAQLRDRLWSRSTPCELEVVSDPTLATDYHSSADTLLAHAGPVAIVTHLARRRI